MNILRSWREIRILMKMRYDHLGDHDFEFEEGQKESMLDNLASKIKKTRNELELLLNELQKH